MQVGQIHFAIRTNTFNNLEKYWVHCYWRPIPPPPLTIACKRTMVTILLVFIRLVNLPLLKPAHPHVQKQKTEISGSVTPSTSAWLTRPCLSSPPIRITTIRGQCSHIEPVKNLNQMFKVPWFVFVFLFVSVSVFVFVLA